MLGRDGSARTTRGAGWRHVAGRAVWALATVGLLALDASGQRTSDPAMARLFNELHAWEDQPLTMARAQAQAGDPAAARATLRRAISHASDARGLLEIEKIQAEMGDREAALKTLLLARDSNLVGPLFRRPQRPLVNGQAEAVGPDLDASVADQQIPRALSDIAIEQCRLGDRAAATETFERALRFARALVLDDRRWAMMWIVAARAEVGDFNAALTDTASIADRAERFETLTQIQFGDRVVDMKILERMLRMIDELPSEFPKGSHLGNGWAANVRIGPLIAMARAQAAANDRAEAAKTLHRARRAAEALEDEEARYGWLGVIARAMVKMGGATEASRMAGTIGNTERNWKWRILTEIAEAHAEIGDPANQKAWDDALQAAETDAEKLSVLFKLADAQMKAGDREAALRTWGQALITERSMKPEDLLGRWKLGRGRDLVEAEIATARADAGDISGAIRLANTIQHIQLQGNALAQIAAAQAAAGDIHGALETAQRIRPPDPKQGFITDLRDQEYALQKIIMAQARAGDVVGALATTDRLGSSRQKRRWGLLWIAEGLGQRNDARKHARPSH